MEMYAFLLRPGLAALDNLADKFVAGWLLPSKVLDLSYPTPPLPLLVFAIQSDEGRQLAGRSTASRRRYRGQDSILIILESAQSRGTVMFQPRNCNLVSRPRLKGYDKITCAP